MYEQMQEAQAAEVDTALTATIGLGNTQDAGETLESCSSVAAGNVPVLHLSSRDTHRQAEDQAVYTRGEGDYGKLGPEGAVQGLKQDVKQMYGLLASIMSRSLAPSLPLHLSLALSLSTPRPPTPSPLPPLPAVSVWCVFCMFLCACACACACVMAL